MRRHRAERRRRVATLTTVLLVLAAGPVAASTLQAPGATLVAVRAVGAAAASPQRSATPTWQAVTCVTIEACTAVGAAADANGTPVAVAVSSTSDGWGAARAFGPPLGPPIDRRQQGAPPSAGFAGIACAAVGRCVAGGWSTTLDGTKTAMVATEVGGAWSSPTVLPGLAALAGDTSSGFASASVTAVACTATWCVVAGTASQGSGPPLAFTASELDGTWGSPSLLQGLPSTRSTLALQTLTCSSAGACALAGTTTTPAATFLAATTTGTFGTTTVATAVASPLGAGRPVLTGLTCGATSTCVATGTFVDGAVSVEPFEATALDGTFSAPARLPGFDAVNVGATRYNDGGVIADVACPSDGNCTILGTGMDADGTAQPVVDQLVDGSWGTATTLDGAASLAPQGSVPAALRCTDVGDCTATFTSFDAAGTAIPTFASSSGGAWSPLATIDGTTSTAALGASPVALACDAGGGCVVVIQATASDGTGSLYVATTTAGVPSLAEPVDVPASVAVASSSTTIECTALDACDLVVAPSFPGTSSAVLVLERAGVWGVPTTEVGLPTTVTVAGGARSVPVGLACPSASSCTTAALTVDSDGVTQIAVGDLLGSDAPSLTALGRSLPARSLHLDGSTPQLACGQVGNCVVGATSTSPTGTPVALLAVERAGKWSSLATPAVLAGTPATVEGVSCGGPIACAVLVATTRPNGGASIAVLSVRLGGKMTLADAADDPNPVTGTQHVSVVAWRCATATRCTGAGTWDDGTAAATSFGVDLRGDVASATSLMGSTSFSDASTATTLACATPTRCVAAGTYRDASGRTEAFVVNDLGGTWQHATPLNGIAELNAGARVGTGATVDGLACPTVGHCTIVGTVLDDAGRRQAFLDRTSPAGWKVVSLLRGAAAFNGLGAAAVVDLECAATAVCAVLSTGLSSAGRTTVLLSMVEPWGVDAPIVAATIPEGARLVATSSGLVCGTAPTCSVLLATTTFAQVASFTVATVGVGGISGRAVPVLPAGATSALPLVWTGVGASFVAVGTMVDPGGFDAFAVTGA